MDIQFRGVRKRSRVKWRIRPLGDFQNPTPKEEYILWRTEKCRLTKEYITMATGLDVSKRGACTNQLTFRIRKRRYN